MIKQEVIPFKTLPNGDKMPAIGMGTFGSDRFTPKQVSDAVYGAIKAGYRMFDGASVYGNEVEIGKVYKKAIDDKIVKREELFIISKVWNDKHKDVVNSCKASLFDLKLDYLDLYFVHWPFPNYHPPGCSIDSRNPDSKPFIVEDYINTWRQMESLVKLGLVKHIGMSNMTIPKLEAVLPLCEIMPAAIEMELHPSFQQEELFNYIVSKNIIPIGFCPVGSPTRPDRDIDKNDVIDMQMPQIIEIAKAHNVHPAIVCLKWAYQRGQIPIPFSVHENEYTSNLECITKDLLTDEEMKIMKSLDRNCRFIKGHVFLWESANDWDDLWDVNGYITK